MLRTSDDGASSSQPAHSPAEDEEKEENDDSAVIRTVDLTIALISGRSFWRGVPEGIRTAEFLLRLNGLQTWTMQALWGGRRRPCTGQRFLRQFLARSLRYADPMAIQCWTERKPTVACYSGHRFCYEWPFDRASLSCYHDCYAALHAAPGGRGGRGFESSPDRRPRDPKVLCHESYCAWKEVRKWHRWLDGGYAWTFLGDFEPRCLGRKSCLVNLLFVRNPVSGRWTLVPASPGGTWTTALKCIAWDENHREYTVLLAMRPHAMWSCCGEPFDRAMIYRSEALAWKRALRPPPGAVRVVDSHGVYFKGTMYWLGDRGLLGFVVREERWETLKVQQGTGPSQVWPLRLVGCSALRLLMVGVDSQARSFVILELSEEEEEEEEEKEGGGRLRWLEIARFSPESDAHQRGWEQRMTVHSFCSLEEGEEGGKAMEEIICLENLVSKTALTYNLQTKVWKPSEVLHAFEAFGPSG